MLWSAEVPEYLTALDARKRPSTAVPGLRAPESRLDLDLHETARLWDMTKPNAEFWRGRTVAVTGGAGFVGTPLVRLLEEVAADIRVVRSRDHDLLDAAATRAAVEGAEVVIHLAARVGGIGFNRRVPGELAYQNLMMACNVFEQSRLAGVSKLLSAGTICAYPKHTPVPFKRQTSGPAIQKRPMRPTAWPRRWASCSRTPTVCSTASTPVFPWLNLYGPGDNFDLEDSHVIPAMIRKFIEASDRDEPEVVLWGTGSASREFLYVDDAARALVLCAERLDSSEPVNIGSGREIKIRDLAELIKELSGYQGEIVWDTSKPDGQPVRYLDTSLARDLVGFEPEIGFDEGLRNTIASFRTAYAGTAA